METCNANTRGSFLVLNEALASLGYDETSTIKIYSILAAILHLGNIDFELKDDTCNIEQSCFASLITVAKLLEVDSSNLQKALTTRSIEIRDMRVE